MLHKNKKPQRINFRAKHITTIPEAPGAVVRKSSSIQTITVGSGVSPDQSLTFYCQEVADYYRRSGILIKKQFPIRHPALKIFY